MSHTSSAFFTVVCSRTRASPSFHPPHPKYIHQCPSQPSSSEEHLVNGALCASERGCLRAGGGGAIERRGRKKTQRSRKGVHTQTSRARTTVESRGNKKAYVETWCIIPEACRCCRCTANGSTRSPRPRTWPLRGPRFPAAPSYPVVKRTESRHTTVKPLLSTHHIAASSKPRSFECRTDAARVVEALQAQSQVKLTPLVGTRRRHATCTALISYTASKPHRTRDSHDPHHPTMARRTAAA